VVQRRGEPPERSGDGELRSGARQWRGFFGEENKEDEIAMAAEKHELATATRLYRSIGVT
jgi:hypothetical protein